MGLGALRALANELSLDAFGLPVTVTVPNGVAVTTTGFWSQPLAETMPFGNDLSRRDPRKVLVLPRTTTLDAVPRGSVILAAEEESGTVQTWKADGIDGQVTSTWQRIVVIRG
jgi:hypothetical protein